MATMVLKTEYRSEGTAQETNSRDFNDELAAELRDNKIRTESFPKTLPAFNPTSAKEHGKEG